MAEDTYHFPNKLEDIPDELKVPDGHALLLQAYRGDLSYSFCTGQASAPRHWYRLLTFLFAVFVGLPAYGSDIFDDSLGEDTIVSKNGLIKVQLKPITHIHADAFSTGFPDWPITAGSDAGGKYSITDYRPVIRPYTGTDFPTDGGASISALYENPSAPTKGTEFNYIHVVSTGGFDNPYAIPHIDTDKNSPTPFYYNASQVGGYRPNPDGRALKFSDNAQAGVGSLSQTHHVSFSGNLWLVPWKTGSNAATMQDGFSWGYDMYLATDGKTTGAFNGGTNTFSWGTGIDSPPSSLTFQGAQFVPEIGVPFVIGNLEYFNGTIAAGTGADSVDLTFQNYFGFEGKFGVPVELHASLQLIDTPNQGKDPVADADFVLFQSGGFSGSFHVFEGQSASIPLYAELTAGLDVISSKQTENPGSLSSPLDLKFVAFGPVTGGGFVSQVPEPRAYVMLLIGLTFIGFTVLIRKRFTALR